MSRRTTIPVRTWIISNKLLLAIQASLKYNSKMLVYVIGISFKFYFWFLGIVCTCRRARNRWIYWRSPEIWHNITPRFLVYNSAFTNKKEHGFWEWSPVVWYATIYWFYRNTILWSFSLYFYNYDFTPLKTIWTCRINPSPLKHCPLI